jgi:MYXO-CTERM domain-containing protein
MRRALAPTRSAGSSRGSSGSSPRRAPKALRSKALATLLVLAAATAPWLVPRGARACSCLVPPPPEQALAEADAVFEARPFGMSSDDQRARYSFEVDRVWKGDVGLRVEISTALHSATCGRSYRIGTQYVIYARRGQAGELTDVLCSRTRASTSAAEDLQVLGAGHEPREQAAPEPEPGPEPTEPPRIEPSPVQGVPVEPPPATPSSRGCAIAMEKPHASSALALLGLFAVAIRRRRAVR